MRTVIEEVQGLETVLLSPRCVAQSRHGGYIMLLTCIRMAKSRQMRDELYRRLYIWLKGYRQSQLERANLDYIVPLNGWHIAGDP